MKSYLVVIGLLLSSITVVANDLSSIRKAFHEAVLDQSKVISFLESIELVSNSSPVMKAYHASAEALLAQLEWNPYNKYRQIQKFSEMMDEAVIAEPENLEIRFLRLSVEFHVPKVLGFSNHMMEDKQVIMSKLMLSNELPYDSRFTKYIMYFMIETELYGQQEIALIKSRLAWN